MFSQLKTLYQPQNQVVIKYVLSRTSLVYIDQLKSENIPSVTDPNLHKTYHFFSKIKV